MLRKAFLFALFLVAIGTPGRAQAPFPFATPNGMTIVSATPVTLPPLRPGGQSRLGVRYTCTGYCNGSSYGPWACNTGEQCTFACYSRNNVSYAQGYCATNWRNPGSPSRSQHPRPRRPR
jgi:hypothetical protein